MIGSFGNPQFANTNFGSGSAKIANQIIGLFIALLGDPSSHGGVITSTNTDGLENVNGILIAVNGAQHSCPIPHHGVTTITAITIKSYINSKLILTYGAMAACGAIILPPNRKVTVEH
jgi:uncharacterized Zn-binding protein involved in type VI secretion